MEFDAGITIVCGPMFAGKTSEFLRRLRREDFAKRKIQVFRPFVDKRYALDRISSHDGVYRLGCTFVSNSDDVRKLTTDCTDCVAVEEVQFFDEGIVTVLRDLANSGKTVICSGLDMDFRGLPFGPMGSLLAIADHVVKLRAVCTVCHSPSASLTQRLINGLPAHPSDPIVLVGGSNAYEARCRRCYKLGTTPCCLPHPSTDTSAPSSPTIASCDAALSAPEGKPVPLTNDGTDRDHSQASSVSSRAGLVILLDEDTAPTDTNDTSISTDGSATAAAAIDSSFMQPSSDSAAPSASSAVSALVAEAVHKKGGGEFDPFLSGVRTPPRRGSDAAAGAHVSPGSTRCRVLVTPIREREMKKAAAAVAEAQGETASSARSAALGSVMALRSAATVSEVPEDALSPPLRVRIEHVGHASATE